MNFLASKAQLRASFLRWALFLVPLIFLLGYLSAQLGNPQTLWFQELNKPALYPPPATFTVVWTILYVIIGLAVAFVASAWGAFGRGIAIILFALHFLGNLAWTPVFFGMQEMTAALVVLAYTTISLLAVIWAFWRVRMAAGVLLLPYLAWLIFACLLNYQFIEANPDTGESVNNGAVERIEL